MDDEQYLTDRETGKATIGHVVQHHTDDGQRVAENQGYISSQARRKVEIRS